MSVDIVMSEAAQTPLKNKSCSLSKRPDLQTVADWINPNQKVLDLGCGDGLLIQHLQENKNIRGYGLEIDQNNIESCIRRQVRLHQL